MNRCELGWIKSRDRPDASIREALAGEPQKGLDVRRDRPIGSGREACLRCPTAEISCFARKVRPLSSRALVSPQVANQPIDAASRESKISWRALGEGDHWQAGATRKNSFNQCPTRPRPRPTSPKGRSKMQSPPLGSRGRCKPLPFLATPL